MSKRKLEIKGYFYAVGATAVWSGNFIVARGLSEAVNPITLAFLRWCVAVVIFFPFAVRQLKNDLKIIRQHYRYILVISFIGVSLYNTLIYYAGHTTPALNLSIISITFPVFVILLSRIFLKEKISLQKILGIIMVLSGAVVLITKGEPSSLLSLSFTLGDLCVLLASIIFAVYSVLLKIKPDTLGVISFQFITFLTGFLILAPFGIIEMTTKPMPGFSIEIIFSVLYIGIFASLIAFVIWNKAINLIGPSRAGMFYYLLPIFSAVLAFIFLGERMSFFHYLSILIIFGGIILATFKRGKQ